MTNARCPVTTGLRPTASGAFVCAVAAVIAPLAAQAPTTQEMLNRIEVPDQRIAELSQHLTQSITMGGGSGRSRDYAAGFNHYVDGTHKNKLNIDVTKQNGSRVENSSPGFRVKDDGFMFRFQRQIAF